MTSLSVAQKQGIAADAVPCGCAVLEVEEGNAPCILDDKKALEFEQKLTGCLSHFLQMLIVL